MAKSPLSLNLGDQIIRSATSAALNYGEAQGAPAGADIPIRAHKPLVS